MHRLYLFNSEYFQKSIFDGTILLFCFLPWLWALAGTILLYFSYMVFVDYCELFRRWISDVRWTFKSKLREQYKALNLNTLF